VEEPARQIISEQRAIVFFAPNWREIYPTDKERTMALEASAAMGDCLRSIYQKLGYEIVDLPLIYTQVQA
jgi:predicted ATPase